jgi:hypothetical protein
MKPPVLLTKQMKIEKISQKIAQLHIPVVERNSGSEGEDDNRYVNINNLALINIKYYLIN